MRALRGKGEYEKEIRKKSGKRFPECDGVSYQEK